MRSRPAETPTQAPEDHRDLTRNGRVIGALAALVAAGLLGWLAWTLAHETGPAPSPLRLKLMGVGVVYFLAVSAYALYAAARVDTRTETGLALARKRFERSLVALVVPLALWVVFEIFGEAASSMLSYGGDDRDRERKNPW